MSFAVTVLDYGLWLNKSLPRFLGGRLAVDAGIFPAKDSVRLGWGLKPSGQRARRLAKRSGAGFCLLEDGFLRSVGLGSDEASLAVVVDDLGIYYDASNPSRLEALIGGELGERELSRGARLLKRWRDGRVSKYNHLPEFSGRLPERYVLVVDQTYGDASIRHGLADEASFTCMMDSALAENPDCTVLVKIHPDVFAGKKRGHFDPDSLSSRSRVVVLAEDVHPVRLLEHAEAIYAVTSQMGFEGLLWGKRVRTFGMPFYAGWGLTEDALPRPERRQSDVCLEQLAHAALVAYPRYLHPESGEACEVEDVLDFLAMQRRMRERFSPRLYAYDFSRWKEPIVRDFLQGSEVKFVAEGDELPVGGACVVWGKKPLPVSLSSSARVVRLEDGFLRSVGLGADLIRPMSWVADESGIYYDATQASDLEKILQAGRFDADLLKRAQALRERIVVSGLTKYNVGAGGWQRPTVADRVILVPGQVESDASIAYGAPAGVCSIRRNMDLLRAVRTANPNAYVIYKPHPDVLAGLRAQGVNEDAALQWCDEQVIDIPMGEMLGQVDEVHVITSLAGFEALLRGKKVTCYGQPFYAGWGLTTDVAAVARRTRCLSLDELVAGALILYPTYVSRTTGRFTSPERALDELLAWRSESGQLPLWRKLFRVVLGLNKR